jgi:hypothetical protein
MWQKVLTSALAAACAALAIVLIRDKPETAGASIPSVGAVVGIPDDSEARAILARHLPEVHLDSVTLEQALDTLARLGQTRFDIHWKAIEAERNWRATRVTLRLWNVTLAMALTAVLDQTESERVGKLCFTAADSVIVVTTESELSHYAFTAVYNARDLIEMIQAEGRTREDSAEELVTHITETIYPDTWRDAGGTIGAIREASGLLIITQTSVGHAATSRLLEQLRAADRHRPIGQKTTRPARGDG